MGEEKADTIGKQMEAKNLEVALGCHLCTAEILMGLTHFLVVGTPYVILSESESCPPAYTLRSVFQVRTKQV